MFSSSSKRHAEVLRLFLVPLAVFTLVEIEDHDLCKRADSAFLFRQGTINLLLNMLEKFDDGEQLEHRQHHVVVRVVDTVLKKRQHRHETPFLRISCWQLCRLQCTVDYFEWCDQLLLRQAGRVSVSLSPESSSVSTRASGGLYDDHRDVSEPCTLLLDAIQDAFEAHFCHPIEARSRLYLGKLCNTYA